MRPGGQDHPGQNSETLPLQKNEKQSTELAILPPNQDDNDKNNKSIKNTQKVKMSKVEEDNSINTLMELEANQKNKKISVFRFFLPGVFDIISKFFMFNGLIILKNDIPLRAIMELVSALILSRTYYPIDLYSQIGIGVILLTILLSSIYYQLSYSNDNINYEENRTIGVILCLVGGMCSSFQFVHQEKHYRNGEDLFYREVAWEGLAGFILSFVLFLLSFFISCPFENIGIFCNNGQSITTYSEFMSNCSTNAVFLFCCYFIPCIIFPLIGNYLTLNVNFVYRSAIDSCRVALMFLIRIFTGDTIDAFLCPLFIIGVLAGMILCIIEEKGVYENL